MSIGELIPSVAGLELELSPVEGAVSAESADCSEGESGLTGAAFFTTEGISVISEGDIPAEKSGSPFVPEVPGESSFVVKDGLLRLTRNFWAGALDCGSARND